MCLAPRPLRRAFFVAPIPAVLAAAACTAPGGAPHDPLVPVTVGQAVAAVQVLPSRPVAAVVGGRPLRLSAVPRDAEGNALNRPVEWASSDTACLQVAADGTATARQACGVVAVTATSQGVTTRAEVAVVVFHADAEAQDTGVVSPFALAQAWPGVAVGAGAAEGRVRVVAGADAYEGGRSLRVDFPRGAVGPDAGGALWALPLGAQYPELYASYRVRFGPGFDFVLGGKLPGLAGGAANSGGHRPNGRDGWSARMMWSRAGRLLQYVYHPDQPGDFGDSFPYRRDGGQVVGLPDRWLHVEHRVVMNTPGRRDGIVQAWVDGVLVLDRRGVRFRDVDALGIDAFHFSTFFGGSERSWAAARDESVYFDDVLIATAPSRVLFPDQPIPTEPPPVVDF